MGLNGCHLVCINITIKKGRINNIYFQELFSFLQIKNNRNFKKMLYEHLLFKTGYRKKGTQKFLAVRGDYLGVEMIGSYHAPGSFEE